MLTSLFSAVSGMNANGVALSVIGDNVANMNTTGFKSSRASFGDILSQRLGTSQIGRGVEVSAVTPMFTQGSFENSTNVLDMAVDGDGLFIVSDSSGTFYTRAGQFTLDKEGYVVNPSEMRLQGYLFSANGTTSSGLGDINLSTLNSAPNATTEVDISANLDSREQILSSDFDETDPDNTSNFSSSVTIYDTLGNGHVINVYFRKDAEDAVAGNTWQWFAVVGASDTASGSTEIQAAGTLVFNNNGLLDQETDMAAYNDSPSGTDFTFSGFNFSGGAGASQSVAFDFGDSITTNSGTGADSTSQFAVDSSTSFQNQDGYSSGSLRSITIDQDGTITGIFTNGQTRSVGQIALAKFVSPTALTKMGKNIYAESTDSGQPIISTPGTSGTGQVLSNTLELSNVDLAEEFVKMIISQRGFQANSRIVSTSDELMAELVNLKR
ncbi:MAG: flagellar hook protein FlgE [Nitrospirae bacterium]|nr:flagellar hook protein FlgE [Nitrospirota bacterium]